MKIAHILAKKKKSFKDGELVKEALISGADSLFDGFTNKKEIMSAVHDLQLSANTVKRKVQDISSDLKRQLDDDIARCTWYALQMDESLDVADTAQLAIMLRMVFEDCTTKEEFLTILPLKERTRGEDIYQAFKHFVSITNLPLNKLSSITTDGAPAMVGSKNGFIALCNKDQSFPQFTSNH